jgi:hypothetical protein
MKHTAYCRNGDGEKRTGWQRAGNTLPAAVMVMVRRELTGSVQETDCVLQ